MKKWILSILGFLCFAGYITYTSYMRISKNFYEVDPGKFYRSAQLTKGELEDTIAKYGIKTVISLRGNPPGFFGEEPEAETLLREKVEFHPLPLSMDYFPSKKELNEILELMHKAPKPILLHCRSGSDRTGMVSALYALEEMKQSKDKAMEQLSIKYWHVRRFHPAMAEFVNIYKDREWARSSYEPCDYPLYKENILECPHVGRSQ